MSVKNDLTVAEAAVVRKARPFSLDTDYLTNSDELRLKNVAYVEKSDLILHRLYGDRCSPKYRIKED